METLKHPEINTVKIGEMPQREYDIPDCSNIDAKNVNLVMTQPVSGSIYLLSRRESIFSRAYERITRFLVPRFDQVEELITIGTIKRRFGSERVIAVADEMQRDLAASNNWNSMNFLAKYFPEQVLYDRLAGMVSNEITSDEQLIKLLFLLFMYANTSEQSLASSAELMIKDPIRDPISFHISLTDNFFEAVIDRWQILSDPAQNAKFINDILLSIKPYLDKIASKSQTGKYDNLRPVLPLLIEKIVRAMLYNFVKNSQDILYGYLGSELMRIEMTRDYVLDLLKFNDMYKSHEWQNLSMVIDEAKDVFSKTRLRGGTLTGEIVDAFKKIESTQKIFTLASLMHESRVASSDITQLYPVEPGTYQRITNHLQPQITSQVERLISRIHLIDIWYEDEQVLTTPVDMTLADLGISLITLDQLRQAYIPPVMEVTHYTKQGNVTRTERKIIEFGEKGFIRLQAQNNPDLKADKFMISDMKAILDKGYVDMVKLPEQPLPTMMEIMQTRSLNDLLTELQLDIRTLLDTSDITEHLELGKPASKTFSEDDKRVIAQMNEMFNLLLFVSDENIMHTHLRLNSELQTSQKLERELLKLDGGIKINDKTGELFYPIRFRKEDTETGKIPLDVIVGQRQMDEDIIAYAPASIAMTSLENYLDLDVVRLAMHRNTPNLGMISKAIPIPFRRSGSITTASETLVWASLPMPELKSHLHEGIMDIRPLRNTEHKWMLSITDDATYWKKRSLRSFISLLTNLKNLKVDSILEVNSVVYLLNELKSLKSASFTTFGAHLAPMYANYIQVGWLSTTWREKRDICKTYLDDYNLSADALTKVLFFVIILEAYGYVHSLGNVDRSVTFRDAAESLGLRFNKRVIDALMAESKDLTVPDFMKAIWSDRLVIGYARDNEFPDLSAAFNNLVEDNNTQDNSSN